MYFSEARRYQSREDDMESHQSFPIVNNNIAAGFGQQPYMNSYQEIESRSESTDLSQDRFNNDSPDSETENM